MITIEIPLTKGLLALVDERDAEQVLAFQWSSVPVGRTTYAQRSVRHADGYWTTQKLHQFITGWAATDHRNGNGLDNRRSNLRQVTHGQNLCNQRLRSDNTSGYKGVTWVRSRSLWMAQIQHHGKNHNLGRFHDLEEAARAYDAAARAMHGEFAALNFPRPGEQPARKAV